MSWMKRRGHTTPSPAPAQGPPVQMYNPNQHSNQDWQQSGANNWYNQGIPNEVPQQPQHQANYWQQPQQYMQPPPPQLQPQQQPQAYNQFQNHHYNQQNVQQPYYQQNVAYDQNTFTNGQQYPAYQQQQQQQQQQGITYQSDQPVKNESDSWNWGWGDDDNSNVQSQNPTNTNSAASVADSFANDQTWNWNVEESAALIKSEPGSQPEMPEAFPRMGELAKKHKISESSTPENSEYQAKTDNCESVSLEQLPPMMTGKRNNKEHLTPQWSIESQVSQESSDDILQTSESDKSHMFSRSSTISHSPVSGQETPLETPMQYEQKPTKAQNAEAMKPENNFESFHTHENKEIVSKSSEEDNKPLQPTPSPPKNQTPPPPLKNQTPPPPMKNQTPPPMNQAMGEENPYKRNIALSHKAINKSRTQFTAFNQSVNLETVPDNSEQPDLAPHVQHKPTNSQFPDNNEIAPINDRNQYLETGQLSDENSTQHSDTLPPPGLSRMVLGQMEGMQNQTDEPPPGLSRMVLGQTENPMAVQTSPPAGLHRMVPGESSSPETNRYLEDDYVSETELNRLEHITPQSRSATIGADTPPTTNATVERETNLDGANTLDSSRRDSIEGQLQTDDVNNLVSSIRDLTVGENPTDTTSDTRRQDGSESDGEHDRTKSPRRRFKDDRREKDRRYSPEYGRDKHRRRYRDRYYDDDTDYYSDKDRRRPVDDRERREDYDKKYGSLRKEKDKSKRRDPREHRDRDGRYYYGRFDDDYDEVHRSRPSSRSDSMHESYRNRGHEREHRRHRDKDREHRNEPFNPYMQGYGGYDPYNPYYQQYQYQYLENIRRTNPQAYAEWYRKYYQQQTGSVSLPYEEKTSIHSGRSSTNDDLAKERYLRQSYYGHSGTPMAGYYREQMQSASGHYGMDDSSISRPFDYTDSSLNLEDTTTASQRLTPAKYSTAHVKASIGSGHLVKIPPHYPIDGQQATVEIGALHAVLPESDEDLRELNAFPGPLVKGVTHKKTIIEYCEMKIRNHCEVNEPESYVLMWELLILLLRQNGMVVGADIAELLMKDRQQDLRPSSVISNSSSAVEEVNSMPQEVGSTQSILKEEVVTNKFREYLLYGSEKEALEWAMKNSLWGHALFLASKLDKRTYANVMMRFANGLPMNDPLQTLYQLLSGRLPAAVTSVSDEKWGDWRPHLAMILSNTTQRPELDRKAITTLADTLMSRGSLYAAQFCYLMAEVGFSKYGSENAKLVLLGANHNKPFDQFVTNEAIHMTEVYEYARSLSDPNFYIPEFQSYKYIISTKMADYGFLESALSYLEQVTNGILQNPAGVRPSLINRVCNLAERLKYYDPIVDDDENEDADLDSSRPDNSWLKNLKIIQQEYNMGLITHESHSNLNTATPDINNSPHQQTQNYEQTVQDPWQVQQQPSMEQQVWQQADVSHVEPSNAEISQQQSETINQDSYNHQYGEQYNNWNTSQQQSWGVEQPNAFATQETPPASDPQQQQQPHEYWNNAQAEDVPRPQISMPNQSRVAYADDGADKKSSPEKAKPVPPKIDKNASSSGWFGGIFSRLALRPKNQMKLPDDKNPSIVWDQEKKRWVNLEEDGSEVSSELKPPPKMAQMMQPQAPPSLPANMYQHQPPQQQNEPLSLPVEQPAPVAAPIVQNNANEMGGLKMAPNMFKMQRNRNLKKSYVDVFNPGGKTSSTPALLPNAETFTNPMPQMNFFIPAPVSDPNAPMDFITPGGMMPVDPSSQTPS